MLSPWLFRRTGLIAFLIAFDYGAVDAVLFQRVAHAIQFRHGAERADAHAVDGAAGLLATVWPAIPVPMAALVVVLPTPPLPEVTTRILAKVIHPKYMKNREIRRR